MVIHIPCFIPYQLHEDSTLHEEINEVDDDVQAEG